MIINKNKTNIIFFKTNRSNITLPDRVHISDVNIVPNSNHPYKTRNINYVYPKHRLTLTEKNVYYSCITTYNKLPPHIKKISTLKLFKKTLFKFLLNLEPYTLNEYHYFKE
nr:unnamed protein product [Callosobruchus analis]